MPKPQLSATRSGRRKARLSATFLRNARTFHAVSWTDSDRKGGRAVYHAAIAIELGLKAYLLHRGFSDDWNRIHLRHDLAKTLRCARIAGLRKIPVGLAELADALGPLYASGALRNASVDPLLPLPPDEVDRVICKLLDVVEAILGSSRHST